MSTFVKNVYLPIILEPHKLTLDINKNIKDEILQTYLHREISGIMAKTIDICKDKEIPLGEIINNQVLIRVPCIVTYKYYRVGDTVKGTLSIEDESNVTVQCEDLICKLSRDSGTVLFSDAKYKFIRNGVHYDDGSSATAILKEAQYGMNSNFVFLASLV
ncbi:RNA polymerase subunit RPO18 [Cetacean poxvirus 1]|nr:RNA polymerase subunit RPO18 [Cetacean poxvirus 1]